MNNNHDNFRKSGSSGQKLTVNTTANMKKAGVKKVIKTGGKVTGAMIGKTLQWILNIFFTILLICTISGIAIAAIFFGYVNNYLIEDDFDIENLKTNLNQTTKIYYTDDSGAVIELEDQRIYGTENRSWVSYNKMPKNLTNAFVAIEDERFGSTAAWTGSAHSARCCNLPAATTAMAAPPLPNSLSKTSPKKMKPPSSARCARFSAP